MIGYGFHFGHDASGAALGLDGVEQFLNKERTARVKHAMGLSSDDLRAVLASAPADAPIGLSTTQDVPFFFDRSLRLSIEGGEPTPAAAYFRSLGPEHPYNRQAAWDRDLLSRDGTTAREDLFPYETYPNQGATASYQALAMVGLADGVLSAWHRKPARLTLDGVERTATFYQHHLLHAYYAAYALSWDRPALIITGDGGAGPSFAGGGIYFWSPPGTLTPVTPVGGWIGEFYTFVSTLLGFDAVGGPGKMMGLAPYGRPVFIDGGLVGTRAEVTLNGALSIPEVVVRWLDRHGVAIGALSGWDRSAAAPDGLAADVAASAQAIFEVNSLHILRAALAIARRARHDYEAVLLCGGQALNCPSNTSMHAVADVPVLVPPAVNDEGLSIGAAAAAFIDRYGSMPRGPKSFAEAVYLGSAPTEGEVLEAAKRFGFHKQAGAEGMIAAAVEALAAGEIVAVLSDRSEVGPRALGRRSLLADPTRVDTWMRVNAVKRRETWRPFAPIVLAEEASRYFDRGPEFSPYMLFNHRCTSKLLPAVTHFDHTSRLQHVTAETGLVHGLLRAWAAIGKPPVLLNTSFNGPGVPIVETADDAFAEANAIGVAHVLTDFGIFSRQSSD